MLAATARTLLLDTLDDASGYETCGVKAFFDVIHALPLAAWARCLEHDALPNDEARRCDAALEIALRNVHPWASWRARDQVAATLSRFESGAGRRLLRRSGQRERLAMLTERAALAHLARRALDDHVFAVLCAPFQGCSHCGTTVPRMSSRRSEHRERLSGS